jgi:hypothetical protein
MGVQRLLRPLLGHCRRDFRLCQCLTNSWRKRENSRKIF